MEVFPPIPTLERTLPSTTITIPPPRTPNEASASSSSRPANLKISISPTLLLPSPPFMEAVKPARKIEEYVDVVVPVGGFVDLDIKVEDEGLDRVYGRELSIEEIVGVEGEIRGYVEGVLRNNLNALGLISVTRDGSTAIDINDDDTLSLALRDGTGGNHIRIRPTLSDPTKNQVLSTLSPSGMPRAYLQKLELSITWSEPGIPPLHLRCGGRKRSKDLESGGNENGNEGEDNDSEDEDDDLVDDGLEGGYTGDSEEDEIVNDEDCDPEFPGDEIGSNHIDSQSTSLIPQIGKEQLREGIARIIRNHMIKQYPLLFDGALQKYAKRLDLPSSLNNSIHRMIQLSSSYGTPNHRNLVKGIRGIMKQRDISIERSVYGATSLPQSKLLREQVRKRRKMEEGIGVKERRRSAVCIGTSVASEGMIGSNVSAVDRTEGYMRFLRESVKPDAGSITNINDDERQLRKLFGEGLGMIGVARWREGRKGKWGMRASNIKLGLELDDTSFNGNQSNRTLGIAHCTDDSVHKDEDGEEILDDETILDIDEDHGEEYNDEDEEDFCVDDESDQGGFQEEEEEVLLFSDDFPEDDEDQRKYNDTLEPERSNISDDNSIDIDTNLQLVVNGVPLESSTYYSPSPLETQ